MSTIRDAEPAEDDADPVEALAKAIEEVRGSLELGVATGSDPLRAGVLPTPGRTARPVAAAARRESRRLPGFQHEPRWHPQQRREAIARPIRTAFAGLALLAGGAIATQLVDLPTALAGMDRWEATEHEAGRPVMTAQARTVAPRPVIVPPAPPEVFPVASDVQQHVPTSATEFAPAESAGESAALEPAPEEVSEEIPARRSERTGRIRSAVNMRSGPAKGRRVLGVVPAKASVEVVGCKAWCEIVYKGKRGFVYKSYVRL